MADRPPHRRPGRETTRGAEASRSRESWKLHGDHRHGAEQHSLRRHVWGWLVGLSAPDHHFHAPKFNPKIPAPGWSTSATSNWTRACPARSTRTAPARSARPGTRRTPSPTPRNSATTSVRSRRTCVARPAHTWTRGTTVSRPRTSTPSPTSGLTRDLSDEEFLAAMERHKDVAPALTAVLAAIKATVKGGGGKLRERPQGRHYKPARKPPVLPASRSRPALVSAAPHRSAPPTTDASAASPCTSPRHTHSACSTPATRERPTSRWAKSSPRDSKRWRHRHRPSLRSPHILDARPTRATTPPTP